MFLFKIRALILYLLIVNDSSLPFILLSTRRTLTTNVSCLDIDGFCLVPWSKVHSRGGDAVQKVKILLPEEGEASKISDVIYQIDQLPKTNSTTLLRSALVDVRTGILGLEVFYTGLARTNTTLQRTRRALPFLAIGGGLLLFGSVALGATSVGMYAQQINSLRGALNSIIADLKELHSKTMENIREVHALLVNLSKETESLDARVTLLESKVDTIMSCISILHQYAPQVRTLSEALLQIQGGQFPMEIFTPRQWKGVITRIESGAKALVHSHFPLSDIAVLSNPTLIGASLYLGELDIAFTLPIIYSRPELIGYKAVMVPFLSSSNGSWASLPISQPLYLVARADGSSRRFRPDAISPFLTRVEDQPSGGLMAFSDTAILRRRGGDECPLLATHHDCATLLLFSTLFKSCKAVYEMEIMRRPCLTWLEPRSMFLTPIVEGLFFYQSWNKNVTLSRECSKRVFSQEESNRDCTESCLLEIPCACSLAINSDEEPVITVTDLSLGECLPDSNRTQLSRVRRSITPDTIVADFRLGIPSFVRQDFRPKPLTNLTFTPRNYTPSETIKFLNNLDAQTPGGASGSWWTQLINMFRFSPTTAILALVSGVLAVAGLISIVVFTKARFGRVTRAAVLLRAADRATAYNIPSGSIPLAVTNNLSTLRIEHIFGIGCAVGIVLLLIGWIIYRVIKWRTNSWVRRHTPYAGYGQLVTRNFSDIINRTLPLLAGNGLMPVLRYPHLINMSLHVNPSMSCLAVILLKGMLSDCGIICFTVGLCEVGCDNRSLVRTIRTPHRSLTLSVDPKSGTQIGVLGDIVIEWTSGSLPTRKAARIEISAPPSYQSVEYEIIAIGIRCVKCGGVWCSYSKSHTDHSSHTTPLSPSSSSLAPPLYHDAF